MIMSIRLNMTTTTTTTATSWALCAGSTSRKRMDQYRTTRSGSSEERLELSLSISTSTNNDQNLPAGSRKSAGHGRISPQSSSLLCPGKTVGIIGGASGTSTLAFLEKISRSSSKLDGEGSAAAVPFVVCSDPALNMKSINSSSLDRNRAEITSIIEKLRGKRMFLEEAGAGCIVMPCHLSQVWHEKVSQGCRVPFFHAAECVSNELKRANLRPLEAGSRTARVGILGSNLVLMAKTYQEKLESEGLEAVVPDKETVEHLVVPAVEAVQRKDMEGARNLLRIAIQVLLIRGVNVVIIASDEMLGLLPEDDPLLAKCIDPMDSLARSITEWAKS